MSHRIAELLTLSEKASTKAEREKAKREVADLILRLWERRSEWSNDWPPQNASALLEQLGSSDKFYLPQKKPSVSLWLDKLPTLEEIQAMEYDIWVNAALVDLPFNEERKALDLNPEDLTDAERDTLELILRRRSSAIRILFDLVAADEDNSGTPLERAKVIAARLKEVEQKRVELLNSTIDEIEQGSSQTGLIHSKKSTGNTAGKRAGVEILRKKEEPPQSPTSLKRAVQKKS